MRVLGIDPGLLHTGWAIVESHGNERKYIASGVILPKKNLPLSHRLSTIFDEVSKIAGWISPVPGGVGPMTITGLLLNTMTAYRNKFSHLFDGDCDNCDNDECDCEDKHCDHHGHNCNSH